MGSGSPEPENSSVPGAQLHLDGSVGSKVSFCDFVRKALRFIEIFQERKDKRTEGDTEGRGNLAKVLPCGGGRVESLENRQAPQLTKYT